MKKKVLVVLGMVLVSSVALADGKKTGFEKKSHAFKKIERKEREENPEKFGHFSSLQIGAALFSLAADQVLDRKQMFRELKRIKDRAQVLRAERESIKGKNSDRVQRIDAEMKKLEVREYALRLAIDANVTVGEFAERVGSPSKKEYAAVVSAQVEKLIDASRVRDALAKLSPVSKQGELAETQIQATPQDATAPVVPSVPCETCPNAVGGVVSAPQLSAAAHSAQ